MSSTSARWIKYLLAIILGNGLYFTLSPYLPPAARHEGFKFNVGTLVDFWFCLAVYGLLELGALFSSRRRKSQ